MVIQRRKALLYNLEVGTIKQEVTVHLKSEKSKRKKHFANYVVFISLFAVTAYTVTAFILQFKTGLEVSPTLTTCFYGFFGVELASLALIKHGKSKYSKDNETGG